MNLLVTGAWQCSEEQLNTIRSLGHHVRFAQYENDALPVTSDWAEGVICNGLFLSHPIEQFRSLRYIQLTSAGFDRVPMDYVRRRGIEIYNARGVYSIPMAEFAVCGVLELYKQSRFFRDNQKERKWEKRRDLIELYGKTVLIVGCGSVGTECAKRFSAFGCNVVGVDLYPQENTFYNEVHFLNDFDSLIHGADIIVLTLPLCEETRHFINRERLERLKGTAIFVNISRGAVVDETALIEILPHIGGAVLDVFEKEPLDEASPLWNAENGIIIPHNSFVGDNVNERLSQLIIENLERRAP